jgi:hypothetical protein
MPGVVALVVVVVVREGEVNGGLDLEGLGWLPPGPGAEAGFGTEREAWEVEGEDVGWSRGLGFPLRRWAMAATFSAG